MSCSQFDTRVDVNETMDNQPVEAIRMTQSNIDFMSISESWRMFRIVSEIVDGFETMGELGPCVSIFGSARAGADTELYKDAEKLASLLVKAGYGVITGGGPGLMEAANKGANEAGGTSAGLHIHLPHEQACNKYINVRSDYRYFFVRKLMFIKYALAYVVMPGGMGTIDELSEAFVLAQTRRIKPFPIILYKRTFWNGLLEWIHSTMVHEGFISNDEIDTYITLCDTPEEIVQEIRHRVIL